MIKGNHNLGPSNDENSDGMQIYAIHGWSDIDLTVDYSEINVNESTNLSLDSIGTLYCDTRFEAYCDMELNENQDGWSCTEETNICENIDIEIITTSTTTTSSTLNQSQSSETQHQLDTEFIIITCGIFVAICYIGFCCWYTKRSKKVETDSKGTMDAKRVDSKSFTKASKKSSISSTFNRNNSNSVQHLEPQNAMTRNMGGNKYHNSNSNNHAQQLHTHMHMSIPNPISVHTVSPQSSLPTDSRHAEITPEPPHSLTPNKSKNISNVTPVQSSFPTSKPSIISASSYNSIPAPASMANNSNNGKDPRSATVSPVQSQDENNQGNNKHLRPYIEDSPPKRGIMRNMMSVIDESHEADVRDKDVTKMTFTQMKQRQNENWDQNQRKVHPGHGDMNSSGNVGTYGGSIQTSNSLSSTVDNNLRQLVYAHGNNRKPMDLKSDMSGSTDISGYMKSPDTWDMFDKENGILGDQHAMYGMMDQLEEGDFAMSFTGN